MPALLGLNVVLHGLRLAFALCDGTCDPYTASNQLDALCKVTM